MMDWQENYVGLWIGLNEKLCIILERKTKRLSPILIKSYWWYTKFEKISITTSARQAWQILKNTLKGIARVKEDLPPKFKRCRWSCDHEVIYMKEPESISDYTYKLLAVGK